MDSILVTSQLIINMSCVFCDIIKDKKEIILENDLAIAFSDSFPVSQGHSLIIPKRHCETYFDLTSEEMKAMFDLSQELKKLLDNKYHPDGYNVGFNAGIDAGQSVMHCHMHVIPRYHGDALNPRGGIRKVVKIKDNY